MQNSNRSQKNSHSCVPLKDLIARHDYRGLVPRNDMFFWTERKTSIGLKDSIVDYWICSIWGVCAQQSSVSSADCQIAGEALELLVTCLSLRQNLIPKQVFSYLIFSLVTFFVFYRLKTVLVRLITVFVRFKNCIRPNLEINVLESTFFVRKSLKVIWACQFSGSRYSGLPDTEPLPVLFARIRILPSTTKKLRKRYLWSLI